ncbi:MAG: SgcJ/EcaC family oxidoreductase [Cyclobacteriaceae bacterium]|nr:SgcJ/EcaC family oxidoreductase [Cyclobacteriaceae bacterium]
MRNFRLCFPQLAIILMAAVCVSCNQTGQPTEADIDAIKNQITVEFKKAWDINDEDAMAEMFLEDADLVFPTSSWIKGKDAVREAFTWDQPEGRSGTFEIEDIRFLDPTTAVVNVNAHFTGGRDNDGNMISDYWDSATTIMKKQNGEWKYAALRVMPARMVHSEVEASIKQSWDRFKEHWEKGDAEGSANLYTTNTINMIPGREDNVNREGFLTMAESFFADNKVENIKANTIELDVIGHKAFEYGMFEQKVIPNDGEPYIQKARYYAVWQLESDGNWRFHRFLFNDLPADTGS